MRTLHAIVGAALLLLAIAGFAIGIWLVRAGLHPAGQGGKVQDLGLLGALAFAAPALLIGTIALAGFGVMLALDITREAELGVLTASLAAQREQLGIQQHIQARMIAARIGDQR